MGKKCRGAIIIIIMTTDINNNNNQIIFCPFCKASITVDELGEHVNANPETKKQAIEEEIQLWGEDVYDRNYLIQNVVFVLAAAR
ncbi:MAG: hypothetical protein ACJ70N_05030 [Nitrososphaera sp.]